MQLKKKRRREEAAAFYKYPISHLEINIFGFKCIGSSEHYK